MPFVRSPSLRSLNVTQSKAAFVAALSLLLLFFTGVFYNYSSSFNLTRKVSEDVGFETGTMSLSFASVAARTKHTATVIFVHVRLIRLLQGGFTLL